MANRLTSKTVAPSAAKPIAGDGSCFADGGAARAQLDLTVNVALPETSHYRAAHELKHVQNAQLAQRPRGKVAGKFSKENEALAL